VIRKRQDVYASETWPLLDIYAARGLLLKVDGMGEIDDGHEAAAGRARELRKASGQSCARPGPHPVQDA
jgi:hypothetical protein